MRARSSFKLCLVLAVILSSIALGACASDYTDKRFAPAYNPKKPGSLLSRMGRSLAYYIDTRLLSDPSKEVMIDENEGPDNEEDDDPTDCNSLADFKNYFFQVYSEHRDANITENDLENMIRYQVKRVSREASIIEKRKQLQCKRSKCFQSKDVLELAKLQYIKQQDFDKICPIMLYNLELSDCEIDDGQRILKRTEVWLIGLALTAVVTLWSWGGGVVLPFIKSKLYKRSLTFMISLAFGVVGSNSILKYLPLADGFDYPNLEEVNATYFFKHMIILFMIFFFFLFERFMKLFAIYKTKKHKEKKAAKKAAMNINMEEGKINGNEIEDHQKLEAARRGPPPVASNPRVMKRVDSIDLDNVNFMGVQKLNQITDMLPSLNEEEEDEHDVMDSDEDEERQTDLPVFKIKHTQLGKFKGKPNKNQPQGVVNSNYVSDNEEDPDFTNLSDAEEGGKSKKKPKKHEKKKERICCTSLTKGMSKVKPIGWMAIFGDGLGNFIDGLSIGASINQSLVVGVTTGIATWLGNIPQELGDFALLVRAGMTPFQALFYNFVSAQSCYIGFIIGVVFGSNLVAARWIFSVSSATAMYISLAVLLPEIKEEFEEEKNFMEKLKITAIQIAGISFGYVIMIILNVYEDSIEF